MDCKQMKKHLFSAIAFVCMIAVADNLALEPSKNEFKIVSPVPSGSTVEMITQALRDVRDDVRLRREKHRHGRRHAAVPRGARQRWGG